MDNTKSRSGVEIVGIKFSEFGKVYYFDPDGRTYRVGGGAIVDTARGVEYGRVAIANTFVDEREIVSALRKAMRPASHEDERRHASNKILESQAIPVAYEKIAENKLDMKIIGAEYTFDNTKLIFSFTSDGRVDFRDLVRDLAAVFKCRIELRQMGIRDEAKLIGGLGSCGRAYCCSTFLPDFAQVSIKMAKEQGLSLNSNKISGACGRLMCCLRYESDAYSESLRRLPRVDSSVVTPDGPGRVIEVKPLLDLVRVELKNDPESRKLYALDALK